MTRRPRILLTNDDGIHAEGLRAAAEVFGEFAELVVVAPDREQSACGHSLTLNRPVRLEEVRPGQFSVDGTPTDCVNLAVHWLLRDQPVDLVVSGINYGLNLGDDVTYSGTVSAALEAHLLGLPAIAFSQQIGEETSFARAAKVAATLVRGLLEHGAPEPGAAQREPPGGGAGEGCGSPGWRGASTRRWWSSAATRAAGATSGSAASRAGRRAPTATTPRSPPAWCRSRRCASTSPTTARSRSSRASSPP